MEQAAVVWKRTISGFDLSQAFLTDACKDVTYTYGRFFGGVQAMAEYLQACDIQKLIAHMENGPELCMLYFACAACNITIIPVDVQKSADEITRITAQHPGAWIVGSERPETLAQLSACASQTGIVQDAAPLFSATDFEKPYLITYTSGSTGAPKGVVHSFSNLILSAVAFGHKVGYQPGDTMYHTMPMTYMAGILNTILLPFLAGQRLVLGGRFSVMEAVSFWKRVKKYDINCFWMAPTMLKMILTVDKKGSGKEILAGKTVRFSVGTAPLDEQLRRQFEQTYGVRLFQSYGLSETLFLTTQCPQSPAGDLSSGMLLEGVELQIMQDGEGCFCVPWNFWGYYSSEETKVPEKWYATGDLVCYEDGNLRICGRKKELIVRGGININPNDIEACLRQECGVVQCVVQGAKQRGEESTVCWLTESLTPEREAGINAVLEQRLGRHYRVDAFVFVDEIPKNLNGKTDKLRLRREWEEATR